MYELLDLESVVIHLKSAQLFCSTWLARLHHGDSAGHTMVILQVILIYRDTKRHFFAISIKKSYWLNLFDFPPLRVFRLHHVVSGDSAGHSGIRLHRDKPPRVSISVVIWTNVVPPP